MSNKPNIEELKYLVPDYITGQISESDRLRVEEALSESRELRDFYNDLKGAFEFVDTVKHEEPSPQYFASLLPRIHQRIEEREARKFSWDKIALLWKILVPAAAVILIALVYYIVKPSDTQMTKDEKNDTQKKTENIKNDSSRDSNNEQQKQPEVKQPELNQPELNNGENIVREKQHVPSNTEREKRSYNPEDNNTAKNESVENKESQIPVKQELAAIELEETSVFSAGEGAGLDEELENDLKKLDNKELDQLLKELQNSNL